MESLRLSDHEQRVYAELFGTYDVEACGKISGPKAAELFVKTGLTQDVVHQITELCGAKRLGHFGRSQFYVALKLIAMAQCSLPLNFETLSSSMEMPPPMFYDSPVVENQGIPPYNQQSMHQGNYVYPDSPIHRPPLNHGGVQPNQLGGGLPPPPKPVRGHAPVRHASYEGQAQQLILQNPNVDLQNTVSPPFSPSDSSPPPLSPGQVPPAQQQMHPAATQANKHYTTSNNATAYNNHNNHFDNGKPLGNKHAQKPTDKGWASFEDDDQGLINSQPKESQWAHFSDHKTETSSISSEAESVDDVWTVTDEQREYYVNQFQTMQPDLKGKINGAIAKDFFEKSRLPVQELSRIWQLSDMDQDGFLSLEEFVVAMHLVVLRRNDVELPEHLPPVLMPYVPLHPDEPFAADLPPGSTLKHGASPPHPVLSTQPQAPQQSQVAAQAAVQQQWTTNFTSDSPTSSSVSSPGTKPTPVNFESKPVIADGDSKIVHPIALRISPDGQPLPVEDAITYNSAQTQSVAAEESAVTSPTSRGRSQTESHIHSEPLQFVTGPVIQGRPRPTPKKAQSISGPSVDGPVSQPLVLLPPPGGLEAADRPTSLALASGGGSAAAPPPPPRTRTGHSRSSSLDTQLIDLEDSHRGDNSHIIPPPAVPPRPSGKEAQIGASSQNRLVNQSSEPQSNFADFSRFPTIPSQEVLVVDPDSHSASSFSNTSSDKHRRSWSLDYNKATSSFQYAGGQPGTADLNSGALRDVKAASPPPGGGTLDRSRSRDLDDPEHRKPPSKEMLDMQAAIRKQRITNTTLSRLNNELNQELQEVMEQRIALEIQLEHLRPFSS